MKSEERTKIQDVAIAWKGGDALLAPLAKGTAVGPSLVGPTIGGVYYVVAVVTRYRACSVVHLILYILQKLS
jgi:hypothetical protein